MNVNTDCFNRKGFEACYYEASGYATFEGKVAVVDINRILLKDIHLCWTSLEGNVFDDKEDHCWIYDIKRVAEARIKSNDCIRFEGRLGVYTRKDKSQELGIQEVYCIETIEDYYLPSDEDLAKRFFEQIQCETCLYRTQCYGTFCMLK